ncbi:MAG: GTP pyrophosphokinase [Lactovum sp.]
MNLQRAIEIAKKAHQDQVDKAGKAYIEHLKTLASHVETEDEKILAYLHDLIEDTSWTLKDLREEGLAEELILSLDLLTKRQGQDYFIYLKNIKKNQLARTIKLVDLKHNSDLSRLDQVTEKDLKRVEKYKKAMAYLKE